MDLKAALLRERLTLYVRLRGGYTFPLAGAIWWAAIAVLGYFVPIKSWALLAFIASGLIFPIAVVLSRLLHVNFMAREIGGGRCDRAGVHRHAALLADGLCRVLDRDRADPADSRDRHGHALADHRLDIRTSGASIPPHAIVRTLAAFAIWLLFPDQRTTWLPASVSIVYLLTVVAILADSKRLAATIRTAVQV